MTGNKINILAGLFNLFLVLGFEVYLFFRLKKTWPDLLERGKNIFLILAGILGFLEVVLILSSFYYLL